MSVDILGNSFTFVMREELSLQMAFCLVGKHQMMRFVIQKGCKRPETLEVVVVEMDFGFLGAGEDSGSGISEYVGNAESAQASPPLTDDMDGIHLTLREVVTRRKHTDLVKPCSRGSVC
eukprot:TRINITY_DN19882_c0_g2_i1.p2 TRINITY_DN19882_c0_g2~~TRINITY_DN19882_c0_g2_i1.p2  ORF type:complete len:119 (+),score=22.38 TRINITY_DN19882_c0_g2_i1:539-895(+)